MISNTPLERSLAFPPYIWWDNGFTEEELSRIDSLCLGFRNSDRFVDAGVDDNNQKVSDIRRSKIRFFSYNESPFIFDKLNSIITRINNDYYGFTLDGYDHIQYAEYDSSDQGTYKMHVDMRMSMLDRSAQMQPNYFLHRKLSVVMMLNDPSEYEGGQFLIDPGGSEPFSVEQKRGRIIAFPSFLLHCVTPVTKGNRKSFAIWVTGPKFK